MSIPLSLYIHFPWCVKKCPYCDFNSHALNGLLPEKEYLNALLEDLKHDLDLAHNRTIETIFLGGGTPSLITPAGIGYLLEQTAKLLNFSHNIEITMEANPGTVEHHNLKDYQTAGINRISLGAQSFNDNKLKALGRIHQAKDTIVLVEQLHKLNLKSFNLDLMHGLPEQTLEEAMQDLETALQLQPPHLSWYQLTLEPNTVFYKYPPQLPEDDLTWEIQLQGESLLAAAGFKHYEVSAFTQPGHACKHNLNYWSFGDYLGIGAGAHAKITDLDTMQIQRSWKTRNPKDYLNPDKKFLAGNKTLSKSEIPSEFMLNQLRIFEEFDLKDYENRTGLPISGITDILYAAQAKDMLKLRNTKVALTALGKRFLNDLMQMFLMEEITND
jgi:putative oxygen-independent coproporphyrinogen III oxidase